MLTTDRNDPNLHEVGENGQQKAYLVLSEEERAKGFVRPVRTTYIHRGRKVEKEGTIEPLEDHLNDSNRQYYDRDKGYVAFLKYPEHREPLVGKFIKQEDLDAFNSPKNFVGGCGASTRMNTALAETYARDPKFYGATFCVGCGKHLPVNEFVWEEGNLDIEVGS